MSSSLASITDSFKQRLNEAPLDPINPHIFDYEDKTEDQTVFGLTDDKVKTQVQGMVALIDSITKSWCGPSWKSCTKLWNVQNIEGSSLTGYFLNIWCQPNQQSPIPKATAKVWFLVQQDLKKNGEYTVAYRFEMQQQVTVLTPESIREAIATKSNLQSNTSQNTHEKNMIYIMNAKSACPTLKI